MGDLTHKRIDELDTISGMLEGVSMRRAASDLGVSAFGISIVELEPGAEDYPEHDHSPDGLGGKMFAERREQLGQELPLDADHIVRIGPAVTRKVTPGPDGLRLLAIGATPGRAYGTGDAL